MGKYHHSSRSKSAYVWFKTLDKTGKVIYDYKQAPCFAQIISSMNAATTTIHVYRGKDMMPYDVPEIKRWIDDLNECGFPCRFIDDGIIGDDKKQQEFVVGTVKKSLQNMALAVIRHGAPAPFDPSQFYNFFIDLKDYEDKSHLFSTLSLIRALSESYMDKIPELYFEMLDADPKIDKFEAMQDAHKQGINGAGHSVTYKGNGSNVTRAVIQARFKKAKQDLFKPGATSINAHWKG